MQILLNQYSPAPWSFDGHGINDTKGQRIAKVVHSDPYIYPRGHPIRNPHFDADSNLIAASPEMLTVLQSCLNCVVWDEERDRPRYDLDGKMIDQIKAVIAKATKGV